MLNLQSKMTAQEIQMVIEKTRLLFRDATVFKTPEALMVYEQGLMDESELLKVCSTEYAMPLVTPKPEYLPQKLLEEFKQYNCVPIAYTSSSNTVVVGVLPELEAMAGYSGNYGIKTVHVPIYYYVTLYTRYYGCPDFLLPLTQLDYLEMIYAEAYKLNAAEITITNSGAQHAEITYNVRKRLVHSKRIVPGKLVTGMAMALAINAHATFNSNTPEPRYFSTRIDIHTRGRVTVLKTFFGWSVTIRLLSDDYLSLSLEDLKLTVNTCRFMRDVFLAPEAGLRLFIGETFSGKNTSILSGIMELIAQDRYKIVSIENPVEQLVRGLIQVEAETEELFAKASDSLLRQNPDMVYFTEITEKTASSVLKQSNTAKAVFSTLHANSIADAPSRLMDITQASAERILTSLQSCVYQKLVRDDIRDIVYPVNRCVHFSEEFKQTLYGLPLHEIRARIKKEEDKWVS